MLALTLKISLLLSLALVLDVLIRRRCVLAVSAIWNATLLAALVLPVAAILLPQWDVPVLPSRADASMVSESPDPRMVAAIDQRPTSSKPLIETGAAAPAAAERLRSTEDSRSLVMTILLALYAAGACVLLVRLAVGWHGCRNIARSAAEMDDPHWLSRFDCWQARLGLPAQRGKRSVRRPSVRLLCSERIAVPATLGIWRRAVVIPASLSGARRETVDAILAHELAHIARDDLAWLVLERIVEAVYWFHPLVWIARRRIAFVRERACDEFAIAGLGDSATYANVLLDLAANASHRRLGLAVPFLRRGNLAARITAIQSSRGTDHWSLPASGRWMLGGGSVMIALLMASMVLRPAQAEEPKPAPPEPPIAQAARDDKPEPLGNSHPITVEGRAA